MVTFLHTEQLSDRRRHVRQSTVEVEMLLFGGSKVQTLLMQWRKSQANQQMHPAVKLLVHNTHLGGACATPEVGTEKGQELW